MGLAVAGPLSPDIDHPKSWVGRRMKLISIPISKLFGHRGITHSIVAVAPASPSPLGWSAMARYPSLRHRLCQPSGGGSDHPRRPLPRLADTLKLRFPLVKTGSFAEQSLVTLWRDGFLPGPWERVEGRNEFDGGRMGIAPPHGISPHAVFTPVYRILGRESAVSHMSGIKTDQQAKSL